MAQRQVEVRVFPAFRGTVRTAWVRAVASVTLNVADPAGAAGASIVLADDATIRDLNARYRGVDAVTDVLSFGATLGEWQGAAARRRNAVPFPEPDQAGATLGEVVISYPQAERQAARRHVSTEREVALLIVHGILHLLGHVHAQPTEATAMRLLQRRALARLFPRQPNRVHA